MFQSEQNNLTVIILHCIETKKFWPCFTVLSAQGQIGLSCLLLFQTNGSFAVSITDTLINLACAPMIDRFPEPGAEKKSRDVFFLWKFSKTPLKIALWRSSFWLEFVHRILAWEDFFIATVIKTITLCNFSKK